MKEAPFKSSDIKGIVNKAKRKSIIRNIIISTISLLVVGSLLIFINGQIVEKAHFNAVEANELLYKISQPNINIGGGKSDYGILSGSYTYQKYKIIEDRIIPWGQETQTFNALGHNTSSAISIYDEVSVGENEEEYRIYNTTNGQRTMLFYHPWFKYTTIQNDLSLIQNAPNDAVMEVAVSFDQPYSVNEVQEFLKLKNKITWYWINEYNQSAKEDLEGLHHWGDSASYVYGFNVTTQHGEGDIIAQNEDHFLATLEKLKSTGNYDYIIDNLLENVIQNKKEGLIVGVVVTGTKEELLNLKDENHIRAISLGAIAKKY